MRQLQLKGFFIMMFLARRAAVRGAEFLDQTAPGWDQTINLTRLDLSSGASCVLGQVYDSRRSLSGIGGLALRNPFSSLNGFDYAQFVLGYTTRDLRKFGFLSNFFVRYSQLDQAWTELITARRAQRHQAKLAQETAYATYAENLAWKGGYEQGYIDGALDEAFPQRITTIGDIASRLR